MEQETADKIEAPFEMADDVLTTHSIGQWLRSAREQSGIDVQGIAKQLRLSPTIIEALENDDFAHLGGGTYIRGYLRSYAKHLDLRDDVIIETFNAIGFQETQRNQGVKMTLAQQTKPAESTHHRGVRWMSTVIVIALLSLTVTWWYQRSVMTVSHTQVNFPIVTQPVINPKVITPKIQSIDTARALPNKPVVQQQSMVKAPVKKEHSTQQDKQLLQPFS